MQTKQDNDTIETSPGLPPTACSARWVKSTYPHPKFPKSMRGLQHLPNVIWLRYHGAEVTGWSTNAPNERGAGSAEPEEPQAGPELADVARSPFRFTVGETYELQNGDRVKIVERFAEHRGYETVMDEHGCHRYDRSTRMKRFTDANVYTRTLDYLSPQFPDDFVHQPLWWHKRGLQQTRSGYGFRLTSEYMLHYNGRLHRVYFTCYGNSSSPYIVTKGKRIYLS